MMLKDKRAFLKMELQTSTTRPETDDGQKAKNLPQ